MRLSLRVRNDLPVVVAHRAAVVVPSRIAETRTTRAPRRYDGVGCDYDLDEAVAISRLKQSSVFFAFCKIFSGPRREAKKAPWRE